MCVCIYIYIYIYMYIYIYIYTHTYIYIEESSFFLSSLYFTISLIRYCSVHACMYSTLVADCELVQFAIFPHHEIAFACLVH